MENVTGSAMLRLLAALAVVPVLLPVALIAAGLRLVGMRRGGRRLSARVQSAWARWSLGCLGVRVERRGTPPAGTFLLVANHVSYLDIMVLASVFRGRFVARHEIARWPLIGILARAVDTLFVRKDLRRDVVRVGEEMRQTLEDGVAVFLFPEGGASPGQRVHAFHTSLLEPAARTQVPCLPVTIHYEVPGEACGAAWVAAWWGGMQLDIHVRRLAASGGVRARLSWPEEPLQGNERKELTRRLREALLERFEPLSTRPEPDDQPWPELVSQLEEERMAGTSD